MTRRLQRKPVLIALAARLSDLERYGLLALVATFVLALAYLARELSGEPPPFRAISFAGAPWPSAAALEVTPSRDRSTAVEPPPGSTRPDFDFFEPPVKLPGRPAVEVAQFAATARTVAIRKGDTLQKIAARELGEGSRWQSLLEWNPGLDPKRLRPGELLVVRSARRAAATTASKQVRLHEVVRDDTLQSIAERYLGDRTRWIDLLEANRDRLRDPQSLKPGMKIRIP